jgi:hypothetical protein
MNRKEPVTADRHDTAVTFALMDIARLTSKEVADDEAGPFDY